MIILKRLKFSNIFSYGEDNIIELDSNPLTQLVGANGNGKSSIPLIIEEVLYNKNSKGVAKADLFNRGIEKKSYSITLEFSKDSDEYVLTTKRASTQSVKLERNGVDISSHTATGTLKLVEEIIGLDHSGFSQLVYQSSVSSLAFLTATDSNRKKFLIELLNLAQYNEIAESIKPEVQEVNASTLAAEKILSNAQTWVTKYTSGGNLAYLQEVAVPELVDHTQQIIDIRTTIANIDRENLKRRNNAGQGLLLKQISSEELTKVIETPDNVQELKSNIAVLKVELQRVNSELASISEPTSTVCPTCCQLVTAMTAKKSGNVSLMEQLDSPEIQEKLQNLRSPLIEKKATIETSLQALNTRLAKAETLTREIQAQQALKQEFEKLCSNFDPEYPSEPLDKLKLMDTLKALSDEMTSATRDRDAALLHNKNVAINNARVDTLKEQHRGMLEEIESQERTLEGLKKRAATLSILQKAFGTNGIVAYKIENMVKDLEDLTNQYLTELSDGRFQLTFKMSGDKLNVVITDRGVDISMAALSSGERARVNTATLLAIRRLMQDLSKTRINLLVLDETLENLDTEGRERLIEVLLQEQHLNIFLISHSFYHPLLTKLQIVKEDGISRIEKE